MTDQLRKLFKRNLSDGALTEAEMAELSDLLDLGDARTPYDRERFRDLVKKALMPDAEPPADPDSTGFVNVPMRGMRPTVAAVDFYADLMRDAIDESDDSDAEKEAELLKRLDAAQLVRHGGFMNTDKASIGTDAHGWVGFVTDGKTMVRSADLFDTSDLSGKWCQSSIDRFGGRQMTSPAARKGVGHRQTGSTPLTAPDAAHGLADAPPAQREGARPAGRGGRGG